LKERLYLIGIEKKEISYAPFFLKEDDMFKSHKQGFHKDNWMGEELRDYLEQKFVKLATKDEIKDLEDRVLHQYHITAEALRDNVKEVAEGVMDLNEKFDRVL
jgi:hypothetical protein